MNILNEHDVKEHYGLKSNPRIIHKALIKSHRKEKFLLHEGYQLRTIFDEKKVNVEEFLQLRQRNTITFHHLQNNFLEIVPVSSDQMSGNWFKIASHGENESYYKTIQDPEKKISFTKNF